MENLPACWGWTVLLWLQRRRVTRQNKSPAKNPAEEGHKLKENACFLFLSFTPRVLFHPGVSPDQHTCSTDRFKCKNNRCIPLRWLCDGDNDCGNDEDESNTTCSGRETNSICENPEISACCRPDFHSVALSARTCPPNQYSCASGRCIPISWTCDLDDDCGDRSDEPASCGRSAFRVYAHIVWPVTCAVLGTNLSELCPQRTPRVSPSPSSPATMAAAST